VKHLLPVAVCVAQLASASLAQITISPSKDGAASRPAPPAASIEDQPRLLEQLKSDREWWGANKKLVELAEGEYEMEVLEATVNLWHSCKDEAVRERTFLVPARLNRRTHFRQRRQALDEEIAGIARLSARLTAEIEKLGDAELAKGLRATAGALDLKVARLKKTVAELDLQDPEFGPRQELTIVSGGEAGGDNDEEGPATQKTQKAPATRPARERPEAPRDDDRARKAGDVRRVAWVRPFKDAMAKARETGRVVLVKPLMGGSNLPDEGGIPCGGKRDCEGSW
jgi:hypothetical protein